MDLEDSLLVALVELRDFVAEEVVVDSDGVGAFVEHFASVVEHAGRQPAVVVVVVVVFVVVVAAVVVNDVLVVSEPSFVAKVAVVVETVWYSC